MDWIKNRALVLAFGAEKAEKIIQILLQGQAVIHEDVVLEYGLSPKLGNVYGVVLHGTYKHRSFWFHPESNSHSLAHQKYGLTATIVYLAECAGAILLFPEKCLRIENPRSSNCIVLIVQDYGKSYV